MDVARALSLRLWGRGSTVELMHPAPHKSNHPSIHSQQLRVAVKMRHEYNVPKAASLRKQHEQQAGEAEEGAEAAAAATGPLEAMAAGAGAKGKKDAADTVNIIKALEEAQEEKALRGCVGKGSGGGGLALLVDRLFIQLP